MASRYALYEIDKLRDRFAPESGTPKGVKPSYNISPVQTVPIIISRDGVNTITTAKWGFIPSGAKDANSVFRYKTFIARSEGIIDKPTWKTAIRAQRCLIPANGFYEWKKSNEGKNPFYIQATDQPLFAFAGLYSTWTDPEGVEHMMCAIVTTNSGAESDMIPGRLPVILHPDDEADWLNPAIDDVSTLYKIMRPYDPDLLSIIRVGEGINSTKIDTPQLIERFVRG